MVGSDITRDARGGAPDTGSLLDQALAPLRRRGLVWSLAKNDFRARYTGSLLGATWAFVQPVLTILLYLFIYQVGFRAPPPSGVPFVVWLIVGMAPWFYFVEALSTTTIAFLEYGFLVKKVLFDVAIVPSIKLVASSLVHVAVFGLVVVIVAVSGLPIRCTFLLVPYYFFALYALVAGLGLITAAIAPFFRDAVQIVAVSMQFLFWLTPVMWPISQAPPRFAQILVANPLHYVVDGLRDALLLGRPFWARPLPTLYFWAFVIVVHLIGQAMFKRLRPHLPDVL